MHSISQFSSIKQAAEWFAWRLRILRRRIWLALTDSPVLRLLAALGILTSGYLTLFLLLGGF